MIDPKQLLERIIRPVLMDLGLWSADAERLVLGTACQESACGRYLVQLGSGPALGIFQMEPATHDDLWRNFLQFRPGIEERVQKLLIGSHPAATQLIGNLYYATAMCRVHYLRDRDPIPDNLRGQAEYWKRVYNTRLGRGTVDEYLNNWQRYVPGGLI